jgi:CRP-like cAMP-binding protein
MPKVAERMEPVSVLPGETILHEGDSPDSFFIIVRGRVGIFGRGEDGTEREIDRLGPGEFFGEIGLLADQPRIATVRALEPTELLRLDKKAFRSLVSASSATRDQLDDVARKRLVAGARARSV